MDQLGVMFICIKSEQLLRNFGKNVLLKWSLRVHYNELNIAGKAMALHHNVMVFLWSIVDYCATCKKPAPKLNNRAC